MLDKLNHDTNLPAEGHHAVTIGAALAMWDKWSIAIPPTGSTGDVEADRKLAAHFCALIAIPGHLDRLDYIWKVTRTPQDFPLPGQAHDPERTELIRWWLQLYGRGALQ